MDRKSPLKMRFSSHRPKVLIEAKGTTARRGIFRPSFWQLLLVVILVLSHELVIVQLRPVTIVSDPPNTNSNRLDDPAVVGRPTIINNKNTNLTILQRMALAGPPLAESFKQQTSFQERRNTIRESFPRSMRFQSYLKNWAANVIDEHYAYLHIFKNGGTTIASQTGTWATFINDTQVQKRKWFTFVRDPIDHFLSGWAECGVIRRRYKKKREGVDPDIPFDGKDETKGKQLSEEEIARTYDSRVRTWLSQVLKSRRNDWHCEVHSYPQINSMINQNGLIPENMEFVGELNELPAVLELVGMTFNHSIETGRNSTANSYTNTYFPRRIDLLSDMTIRSLCRFLALDYYVLDYPYPEPCRGAQKILAGTPTTIRSPVVRHTSQRLLKVAATPIRAKVLHHSD